MFVIPNKIFTTVKERLFLLIITLLTFAAIVLSQSRGVWIALIPACAITLFLHDRKKAFVVTSLLIVLFGLFFATNSVLKQRASSIVTSIYTENETGSTGNRLELWKGSLYHFPRVSIRRHRLR